MRINAKLDGVNAVPQPSILAELAKQPFIIMGNTLIFSVVTEPIEQLHAMVKKALKDFGRPSARIVFFRDGLSFVEAVYQQFHSQDPDKPGNCPAGFVADQGIGNPIAKDYYLQLHGGLLGTVDFQPAGDDTMFTKIDDDDKDDDVQHARVEPQQPTSTRQTAVKEANDTVNPDVKNVRPTMPAGTSNKQPNEANEERQGEKDERDENDSGGDEDVLHTHVVPHPTPSAREPPPPSVPLEGEQGDESSRRACEAAMHEVEPPQAKQRGQDDDVQHARVEPQEPQMTGQTAVNDEATDTSNPHANGAGTTMPVGTSNGRDREGDERDKVVEEKGEWASGIKHPSSNDDSGDEDVRHVYIVPNTTQLVPYHALPIPNKRRPPPSVPLEGEKDGTPYDETSNIEGPGGAVGGDDETSTLHGDDEGRQQGQEASDEDQEGQETGEGSREVEETTNVDNDSQYTSNDEDSPRTPPEPPPIQTPPPP
ncbi:hypothetical protein PAXINDRAFT_102023 [Paxillus involutus ATCC 200175]|uniref:Uncharacterized protein n=1 Tax=Paxillus involutus ATCC 200175 TaxID=664439 RepID=A0A0C9TTD3_PAXIN|nr:hypothetical protein PAXINDRAFT_102023 [Paxillus involutus ATCC 200175]